MPEQSVDPKKAQLVSETDDTYKLTHPDLGTFDVAKKDLSDDTHSFIKGLKPEDAVVPDESTFVRSPMSPDQSTNVPRDSGRIQQIDRLMAGSTDQAQKNKLQSERDSLTRPASAEDPKNFPSRVSQILSVLPTADDAGKEKLLAELGKFGYTGKTGLETAQPQPAVDSEAIPRQVGSAQPDAPAPEPGSQPSSPGLPAGPMQVDPFERARQLAQQEGDVESAKARQEAQAYSGLENQLKQAEQRRAGFAADRIKAIADREAAMKDEKIDPHKAWATAGTGGQALAVVSLLLGGIGQGILKLGSNPAGDVMDKIIERDIASQKDNIGLKSSLYSEHLRQLGDAEAAEMATKNDLYSNYKVMLEKIAAQSRDPQAKIAAATKINAIDLEQKKLILQEADQRTIFGGPTGGAPAMPRLTPAMQEHAVRANGQVVGFVADPKDRKEVQEKVTGLDSIQKEMGKLAEMFPEEVKEGSKKYQVPSLNVKIPMFGHLTAEKAAEAHRAMRTTALKLRNAFEGARLNPSMIENFTDLLGEGPNAVNVRKAWHELQGITQTISDDKNGVLQNSLTYYTPSEKKEVAPVRRK